MKGLKPLLAVASVAMLGLMVSPAVASPSKAALNDFARCAVGKDRVAATRAAARLPLSNDPASIAGTALGAASDCAEGGEVQGSAMMLRGAIAQALYRADFREVGIEPRTPARNFADLGWPAIGDDDPVSDSGVALFKLADCIARNDSENVDKLMRFAYGTDQAHKMIEQMQPYIQACYPKGADLQVGRDTLHAAIAQGAYYAAARLWSGKLTAFRQK
jgi:hypothetical protein